jgi:hypothetical protein
VARGKTKEDYEGKYTDPELRERLKEEIKASDKGGAKGQWSARKSQLLVKEYEKAGGGYKDEGELTASQRSLEQWSDQDWETKEGSAQARGDGETARYLPDQAWELLSKPEREQTDQRKREGDRQHVENTDAAKEARKAVELLHENAEEARQQVAKMGTRSQFERARKAEQEHGKARKTVLEAIDARLEEV